MDTYSEKRKVGRPKNVPLKRANILIRDLDKSTNDLIDQVCKMTGEKTAAKAVMVGLQQLVELQAKHDKQGEKLEDLQDKVSDVLNADESLADFEQEREAKQNEAKVKRDLLKSVFESDHEKDVKQRSWRY